MRSNRTRRRPTTPRPTDEEGVFRVERLGADGDGIADGGEIIHVEGALPGETVVARGAGAHFVAGRILAGSPSRVRPPCPLAGACGGCSLQHWDRAASLGWKTDRVEGALREAGFDPVPMRNAFQVEERTRRRMTLAVSRQHDDTVRIGLRRRRGHEIVDMTTCHVLLPGLFALLAPLRALFAETGMLARSETGSLTANRLENGADLLIRTERPPDATARASVARFAEANDVARISWHADERAEPEPVAMLRRPALPFGERRVEPSPGAFLQAVPSAERLIVDDVVSALDTRVARKGHVVELYAGTGTLTFPLAAIRPVRAYEGDRLAFDALKRAAGGTRVDAIRRDLARAPLSVAELRDASAVVLDPPFAGASRRQIDELAGSRVPTVVIVSCNPAALAREAAVLRRAGYALDGARAIDQFLFSARVESVTVFRRRT